jgi:Flp pilus assembly protein TadB
MNAHKIMVIVVLCATHGILLQATNYWSKTKEEKVVETKAGQAKKEIDQIDTTAKKQIDTVVKDVKDNAVAAKTVVTA